MMNTSVISLIRMSISVCVSAGLLASDDGAAALPSLLLSFAAADLALVSSSLLDQLDHDAQPRLDAGWPSADAGFDEVAPMR